MKQLFCTLDFKLTNILFAVLLYMAAGCFSTKGAIIYALHAKTERHNKLGRRQ